MITFSRALVVLVALLVTLILTVWHTRNHIAGLNINLENIRFHEWIGDKGRSASKSEAMFQRTLQQRHDLLAQFYPDRSTMTYFPDPDNADTLPFTIWEFFPATYNCPFEMQRVGSMGDGGKWVCGLSRYITNQVKPCVIYSFGVYHESSFEQSILEETSCEIWGYDYNVETFGPQVDLGYVNTRAHFLRAGLGSKTDSTVVPPIYTIKDLMALNGHDFIDIIKMDLEGGEYASMTTFLTDFQNKDLPVGQIIVDINVLDEEPISLAPSIFIKWFEAIEDRHMRAVWTESDMIASMAEYTLINTKDKRSFLMT